MPPQGRLGDKAQAPIDVHGCPACPHPTIGPAVIGSPTVSVNKRAALRGDWRVAENTLHGLALLCGWPGALLAQELLRHKSAKPAFRRLFWLTAALNVLGFVLLFTPLREWATQRLF